MNTKLKNMAETIMRLDAGTGVTPDGLMGLRMMAESALFEAGNQHAQAPDFPQHRLVYMAGDEPANFYGLTLEPHQRVYIVDGDAALAKCPIPPRDQALCNDGSEPDWDAYEQAEAAAPADSRANGDGWPDNFYDLVTLGLSSLKQDYSPECLQMASTASYVEDAVATLVRAGWRPTECKAHEYAPDYVDSKPTAAPAAQVQDDWLEFLAWRADYKALHENWRTEDPGALQWAAWRGGRAAMPTVRGGRMSAQRLSLRSLPKGIRKNICVKESPAPTWKDQHKSAGGSGKPAPHSRKDSNEQH